MDKFSPKHITMGVSAKSILDSDSVPMDGGTYIQEPFTYLNPPPINPAMLQQAQQLAQQAQGLSGLAAASSLQNVANNASSQMLAGQLMQASQQWQNTAAQAAARQYAEDETMANLKEQAEQNIYVFMSEYLGANNAMRISTDIARQFTGEFKDTAKANIQKIQTRVNPRWDDVAKKTWIDIQVTIPGNPSVYLQTYADGGCVINKSTADIEIKTRLDLIGKQVILGLLSAEEGGVPINPDSMEQIYG